MKYTYIMFSTNKAYYTNLSFAVNVMDTKLCRKFYKNIKFDFQTNEKKISLSSCTGIGGNSNAGNHKYRLF